VPAAELISAALRAHFGARADGVRVESRGGRAWLRGAVAHAEEREAIVALVAALPGIAGVDDHLTLHLHAPQPALDSCIRRALVETALRDAAGVQVSIDGPVVTLRGRVHSATQFRAAESAAMGTRGVTRVVNELLIEP